VVLSCLQDGPVASIHVHHDMEHYFVYQRTGSTVIVRVLPGTMYLWSVEWSLRLSWMWPCTVLSL